MTERVIFRKWLNKPHSIIALLPDIDAGETRGDKLIQSFEHIGQHGGANYTLVMCKTIPAMPKEYASLKRELEDRGYHLKVVRRR